MTDTPSPAHHRPAGGFRNPWAETAPRGFREFLGWMLERARRGQFGPPPAPPALAPVAPAFADPRAARDDLRVTAIGHSTFLVQAGGLNILTDPVFSARCSPFRWAGPKRRQPPGIALEALPPIDLVLQSHDHYDHLDDASVRDIAARHPEALWCAPLGVAAFLKQRGVRHVAELDWWEGFSHGAAEITCVPAAHFSGRTPFDRDAALWCGWAIAVTGHQVYFAGDTGHHPDFATIGARLGPCDAIFLPIGAYEPRWFMRPVHMDPEEALDAFDALTAAHRAHPAVMVAMHWGTFVLTDEPPDEPPERARAGWAARGWPADRLWLLSPGETRRASP
jgi:N-acyl-phosphatidylethanolamine-hydrolysing phospholipase D